MNGKYTEKTAEKQAKYSLSLASEKAVLYNKQRKFSHYDTRRYRWMNAYVEKVYNGLVERNGHEKEFLQVFAGATVKAAYQGDYDQLVKAAHAVRKLFTDIEKEAY